MSKPRIKYICSNCGYESLRWLGKCPSCDTWSSFSEELIEEKKSPKRKRRLRLSATLSPVETKRVKVLLPYAGK